MAWSVETVTHYGQRKLKQPQLVFKFQGFADEAGELRRDIVHRQLNRVGLRAAEHYVIHPSTLPGDHIIRVCWFSDEAFIQAKMAVL